MKNAKPLFFILFIALILWPISYFLHGRETIDPHAQKLQQIVQDDEFLIGLHNKHSQGCVALKHLADVDTVIIGSSRAYASIDAYALKEALNGQRIGICAISSWNTDFLHEFITFLEKEDVSPKRLIWIVDSAVPLRLGLHEKRLEYAKAVFSDSELQKKMSDKWVENKDAKLPILGLSKDAYLERMTFHKNQIENIPVNVVRDRLDTFEEVAIGNLAKVMATAKVNPFNTKNLRRFCTDLKLHGINLDIVVSPVPNKVASLVSQSMPDSEVSNLLSFFEIHTPCAKNIIDQSLEDWRLDERHFMNRNLKDDYPYDIWNVPEEFGSHYADMSPRLQPRFYSPDHLNAVGAHIFTKELADIIRE